MINYLPFARRETVAVPAKLANRVLTGGQVTTNLPRMGTAGARRAIIEDIIIFEGTDTTASTTNFATDGGMIKARIGIDGKQFLTEDVYDYRVMADMARPCVTCWDWSRGGRYPYRLYADQEMLVAVGPSPNNTVQLTDVTVRACFFSGVHVKNNQPYHLYEYADVARDGTQYDLYGFNGQRMRAPKDSAVDLFSLTLPEWLKAMNDTQVVYVEDGNGRPFWDSREWGHILDPPTSPISLGVAGWAIEPDETLVVELRNDNDSVTADQNVTVIVRGVLEVEDGR